MQHVNASDYMSGSAKQAVDTAMSDARSQVVGATTVTTPATPRSAAEAGASTTTAPSTRAGASA